jgi:hypothetical protein
MSEILRSTLQGSHGENDIPGLCMKAEVHD